MLQLPHALQCPCGESDSEQPTAPRKPGGWGWDACFCLCHMGIWCLLGRKVLQAIDRELWEGFQRYPSTLMPSECSVNDYKKMDR